MRKLCAGKNQSGYVLNERRPSCGRRCIGMRAMEFGEKRFCTVFFVLRWILSGRF
jgi:hypothetical protein